MFIDHPDTRLHLVTSTPVHTDGFVRHVISTRRRSPHVAGVYVAHPITGIRVSRIHEMQDAIRTLLATAGEKVGLDFVPLFPMRTNHLGTHQIGDNVYAPDKGDFARTRHYTLQNRMDAIVHCDAVLVNYDLAADDGTYRMSNGIPFDIGWAAAADKPTVIVQPTSNPNPPCRLANDQIRLSDIEIGVNHLAGMLAGRQLASAERVIAEIIVFPPERSADALACLAMIDARRHRQGCRAIIAVMDEAAATANRHGQVDEIADWLVPDEASAFRILDRLLAHR